MGFKAAFVWAWAMYRSQLAAYIALSAVVAIVLFAQQIATKPIVTALENCIDATSPGQVNSCEGSITNAGLAAVVAIIFSLIALLASAGVMRAALGSTRGQAPSFADMLTGSNLWKFLIFSFLYTVLQNVGLLACFFPIVIVTLFFQLGPYFILDRGVGPLAAFKASAGVMKKNFQVGLWLAAITLAVLILGSFTLGLATLITLPMISLITAHLYRQFNDEAITPSR